jgi:spermidine synthase
MFATAFITGAVVMALEMLGSRLLAPVFGNSLFVWGALIGVILAAMSCGYTLGGWLVDRYAGGKVLAGLLLCAGAWTFLLAWKGHPVMFLVAEWIEDPRWGPCLAASILLAPPACGLSGVLPALLRLSIADLGHLGRHTGVMIAVSTVGSLVGTWGTAFFLLSWLGSVTLIALLGAVQLALGLVWWWWSVGIGAKASIKAAGLVVLGSGGLGLGWLAIHPDLVLPTPLYQEDSPYQQIRVRDTEQHRYLILDRTFHAIMWRADPLALYLPYSQMMMVALAVHPAPKQALILGQGGGSIAKWLAKVWPQLNLDVVEVDPSVVKAAEQFFDYHPIATHRVFAKDARVFLQHTDTKYDIIWIDAFARHLIPFHLTTKEFFEVVRAHLTPDGIVVINLASTGGEADQQRANAVVSTIKTVFSEMEAYGVAGHITAKKPGAENLLFFLGSGVHKMKDPQFYNRLNDLVSSGQLPPEVFALMSTHREDTWDPGFVFTDNYAPFDLLMGSDVIDKGVPGMSQPGT